MVRWCGSGAQKAALRWYEGGAWVVVADLKQRRERGCKKKKQTEAWGAFLVTLSGECLRL